MLFKFSFFILTCKSFYEIMIFLWLLLLWERRLFQCSLLMWCFWCYHSDCSFWILLELCRWPDPLHENTVCLFLSNLQAQYHDGIKLLEAVSRYKAYLEVSHLRPSIPVSKAPKLWWKYAAQAGLQQKRMWVLII